jgi:DNA replication protein DnaC
MEFSNRWVFSSCDHCEEQDRLRTIERSRQRARRNLELSVGGEKPAESFTFEKYKPKTPQQGDALLEMKRFVPESDNVYLHGPCRSGKTHLATSVAISHHQAGLSVLLRRPEAILRSLRMISAEDYEVKAKTYSSVDVLVIDDLGAGNFTDFSLSALCEIIDMRIHGYKNGLIVTSNLSLDDLAEKLGDDRLPSRLAEISKIVEVR